MYLRYFGTASRIIPLAIKISQFISYDRPQSDVYMIFCTQAGGFTNGVEVGYIRHKVTVIGKPRSRRLK